MRRGVAPAQPEPVAVDPHEDVARHRTLAVADRGRDHLRHPAVTLDRGDVGRRGGPGTHARLQRRGGGQHDLVLAEGREHFVDVAEEDRARAHEQHTLRAEPLPVRVEEVRGAVQRHRRLPGAGATGDHEDPGERRPDRFVLLGLDGGDDVAHPPGALEVERGEERALPHHGEARRCRGVGVEDLVVEADQAPAVGLEVPAAGDAHRLDRGGAVERLGDRRPPVDHERREVVVGDRDPADVERPGGTRSTGAPSLPRADAVSARSRRPKQSGVSPMSSAARRRRVLASAASRSSRACRVPPSWTE